MTSIHIPTVDVAKLDQRRAGEGYGDEVGKLLNAACSPGFFYVDFKHAFGTELVLREVYEAYAASERYFDQSLETKMKDFREGQPSSSDRGYKYCETDESFESPLHRVTQLEDGAGKRFFLSYFLRPEEGAKKRVESYQ
ncbi:hypothetical protein BDV27DRAFT_140624 [Aspergillus caelatus]|uniref:Uncharacterized protein n=2 Tax=Aspergillus subgen. Circumdati TaxID=2720871 RepID=A0A5N7AJV7_9EURO|nr:uncharacterized protein BDV27DRAFT_140624 [Aspergillus caelatus]KAE8370182.1 hypothetical protein BDV27DRAFT_140624 [Aspergillus caelatus]KAE8420927.1 hypothetical protein BDV36DRAFT_281151 [Aspergillus pseudocaelatus]